jgi:ketose-bisphosphate aldolase
MKLAITCFPQLLSAAEERGAAVGAFTCYDLVTGGAVLAAAERREVAVILLISAQAAQASTGAGLICGLRRLAEESKVPCCLQLDHCADLHVMRRALRLGVGALMADGSKLPWAKNIALVSDARRLAAEYNAAVEAELGHVSGDEEGARATTAGALTDPDDADAFIRGTEADCLAVSIGNVHGPYRHEPKLDFRRLHAIRETVCRPLCLHGSSGLSDMDLSLSVAGGIAKFNFNSELRARWFDEVRSFTSGHVDGAPLLALQQRLAGALEASVDQKLASLRPGRKPRGAPTSW